MADLDLRLVRYFIAVAAHRHFGRAAEALHITQPSLSRQIVALEHQLGARLLDRTPRGTRLTEAGQVFLPRARALLRAAEQAGAEARAAAEPSRFTVGFTSGLIVTSAVRELRRRHPDADVRSRHLRWDEARTALLEHRVDAAVTRLPFPTDQLEVTVLYDEPRAVVVPVDHRLAGKESVTVDDIADEPMPRIVGADPAWAAFWRLEPRPDGRPVPEGPEILDLEDKFEAVAAGEALVITAYPTGVSLRPDVTAVPLHGVEPSQVALATRAGDRSRLVSAFRKIARTRLTGPSEPA
ncbi:LysR substrate-binding domain-containing protein [Streptomyces sp. TLI_185]|uniref:LysR substrate-binding domain-containing protein n=1 Tax=Streptomyces sp. TLI_185 TaxID=2485151 RepID=UPI000F4D6392|nr:LysR substrate-binding domain-containing protein [Streptomyces sp. TLI_185]RPF33546.1 DNA-binding transcriptional LysR family regulator [Streptomyces sp. TLI_185]